MNKGHGLAMIKLNEKYQFIALNKDDFYRKDERNQSRFVSLI